MADETRRVLSLVWRAATGWAVRTPGPVAVPEVHVGAVDGWSPAAEVNTVKVPAAVLPETRGELARADEALHEFLNAVEADLRVGLELVCWTAIAFLELEPRVLLDMAQTGEYALVARP